MLKKISKQIDLLQQSIYVQPIQTTHRHQTCLVIVCQLWKGRNLYWMICKEHKVHMNIKIIHIHIVLGKVMAKEETIRESRCSLSWNFNFLTKSSQFASISSYQIFNMFALSFPSVIVLLYVWENWVCSQLWLAFFLIVESTFLQKQLKKTMLCTCLKHQTNFVSESSPSASQCQNEAAIVLSFDEPNILTIPSEIYRIQWN